MNRPLAALLVAAVFFPSLTLTVSAGDWPATAPVGGFAHQAPQDNARWSAPFWPRVDHSPAITRTLSTNPLRHPPAAPQQSYEYQWQQQPAPPAPVLAPPTFSYPQQGYYPREQIKPQLAPGYEYDFGGSGARNPLYPIEGAMWKEPHSGNQHARFDATVSNKREDNGYTHCPL